MPKRIAMISDHASPLAAAGGVDAGGQNVYVAQVARHLAARGHRVDVFTRRDSPLPDEVVDFAPGVRVIHVPAGPAEFVRKEELLPVMSEFAQWMTDFCRREGGYDVVHAHFFMSGLVALRLKRRLGTPFVMTFHALGRVRRLHQGDADQFPAVRLEIEDRLVREADAIIAECPQDLEDMRALYGACTDKISIIPCGFDASEFWPISRRFARRALGFRPDEHIVVNIGRMVPRKGVDNAIRGVARLARDHGVRSRLLVVGGNSDLPCPVSTPEIGRLKGIAAEEGIPDLVTFTGRRSRELLKLYYSAADVFITTPWYEPFGITPLESMACGTPVVGADVGGIKYSIAEGVCGYLVPPRDPDALAARLAELYGHPEQLARFSRNGVRRVNASFTWRKVSGAISNLYDSVAVRPAVRRAPRRVVSHLVVAA